MEIDEFIEQDILIFLDETAETPTQGTKKEAADDSTLFFTKDYEKELLFALDRQDIPEAKKVLHAIKDEFDTTPNGTVDKEHLKTMLISLYEKFKDHLDAQHIDINNPAYGITAISDLAAPDPEPPMPTGKKPIEQKPAEQPIQSQVPPAAVTQEPLQTAAQHILPPIEEPSLATQAPTPPQAITASDQIPIQIDSASNKQEITNNMSSQLTTAESTQTTTCENTQTTTSESAQISKSTVTQPDSTQGTPLASSTTVEDITPHDTDNTKKENNTNNMKSNTAISITTLLERADEYVRRKKGKEAVAIYLEARDKASNSEITPELRQKFVVTYGRIKQFLHEHNGMHSKHNVPPHINTTQHHTTTTTRISESTPPQQQIASKKPFSELVEIALKETEEALRSASKDIDTIERTHQFRNETSRPPQRSTPQYTQRNAPQVYRAQAQQTPQTPRAAPHITTTTSAAQSNSGNAPIRDVSKGNETEKTEQERLRAASLDAIRQAMNKNIILALEHQKRELDEALRRNDLRACVARYKEMLLLSRQVTEPRLANQILLKIERIRVIVDNMRRVAEQGDRLLTRVIA